MLSSIQTWKVDSLQSETPPVNSLFFVYSWLSLGLFAGSVF